MRRIPFLLAVLCLFLALAGGLAAQAVTGALLGTVTDSSGAAVPNAKVLITAINTGISRSTETNAVGFYSIPTLEPGVYRVTVEREGFRKAVKDRVEVLVNTTVRADLELAPGTVSESVTVTAEVAMLQTDRADTGRKLEQAQLVNMPLAYNRNFQALLNLVPGTSRAFQPHSEFFNSQGALSTQVNGLSRLANNVQFEGVDNNHRTGLLSVLIPPLEALETVDVSTGNYEAELGRAGGAVTNIMLRSGTNDLHGDAYWYNQVSRLRARDTFSPGKPVTTYNNFGFTLGGPIKKNKTFIFGDYSKLYDRRGDSYIITVPGQAFRNGDFSAVTQRIYDPLTGDPVTGAGKTQFTNNQIPDARISPIARRILAMVPLPNLGSGLTNNYAGFTVRKKDSDSFDVKVDHQQSDKNRWSGRYSFQRPVVTDPGRFGIAGGGGKGFAATGVNRTQSAAINYTRLFSPTLITEARVGLGRYSNVAENLDIGTNAAEAIGIRGANLDRWSSGISSINVGGYANPLVGYQSSLPWNRAETNIDIVNNWTKVLRNHTIKFGLDVRRLRDDLLQTQDAGGPRGEFQFGNNQTSISGQAVNNQTNALASFLLDIPSTVRRDLAVAFPAYRQTMWFTYIQDKWQVTPKLTADLGLRHELYLPPTPRFKGGFANYDWTTNNLLVAGYGNVPMNLGRKTYYTNFAPRVGLAYRLDSKTVIRAGAGLTWVPYPDNKYAWDNFPVKQSNSYGTQQTYGRSVISPGVYGSMAAGFPAPSIVTIPSDGIIPATTTQLLASAFVIVPLDYREGYVESFNFAVQRQLPGNFTLDVAYVGNHTVRAPVNFNLNASQTFNSGAAGRPLFARFNKNVDLNYRYVGVSNNFNSLQVKFDRRFSGGFMMTTAYTYGKALGYASEAGGLTYYINPRRNYARLDFDRTHTYVQSYVYELPFGPRKRWLQSGPGRWLLGDWQVNGVLTLMTGRPINFTTNVASNTPGNGLSPDINGPVKVLHGIAGPAGSALWFDTAVFSQPNVGGLHFGNVGRNAASGPGLWNLDFSVFRKFPITERWKGEFRFEAFNLTNTPAFGNPNTQLGSNDFGKVTGTLAGLVANQGVGGTGSRVIQLGLKISF
jgi:hypothetical protein